MLSDLSYARTGGRCGVGLCGEEKLPKRDRRMQRLCKTCQNATVECRDCAKPAKMRPLNAESERKLQKCYRMRERGAGAGCVNAVRKSCQNATVKCGDCAKPAKMRPLKAESERKLQKMRSYARTGGTCGVGECGEEKLPKRDRRMQRLCKTCQNATIESRE